MHRTILKRLQADGGSILPARLYSGRVSIVCAFAGRAQHPVWVAKHAVRREEVACLRREYEALVYLSKWTSGLGVPEILEWDDRDGEAVLILSGVPGRHAHGSLPMQASAGRLRDMFQPPIDWLARFHAAVPCPERATAADLASTLVSRLGSKSASLGSGIDRIVDILGEETGASGLPAVPVHGDFYPSNVLFTGRGLSVVDWTTFGAGFPLQDTFSFLVNTDYFRAGHVCTLVEKYHHVFFSSSPLWAWSRRELEHRGCSQADARYLFYGFLADQICADASTPAEWWRDVVRYIERYDFPAPGTILPAPETT